MRKEFAEEDFGSRVGLVEQDDEHSPRHSRSRVGVGDCGSLVVDDLECFRDCKMSRVVSRHLLFGSSRDMLYSSGFETFAIRVVSRHVLFEWFRDILYSSKGLYSSTQGDSGQLGGPQETFLVVGRIFCWPTGAEGTRLKIVF